MNFANAHSPTTPCDEHNMQSNRRDDGCCCAMRSRRTPTQHAMPADLAMPTGQRATSIRQSRPEAREEVAASPSTLLQFIVIVCNGRVQKQGSGRLRSEKGQCDSEKRLCDNKRRCAAAVLQHASTMCQQSHNVSTIRAARHPPDRHKLGNSSDYTDANADWDSWQALRWTT